MSVRLVSGSSRAEDVEPITREHLVELAASAAGTEATFVDIEQGAVWALEYEAKIASQTGGASDFNEEVAIGWVAAIVGAHALEGPWRGRPSQLHRAMVDSFGGFDEPDNLLWAARINARAAALWSELVSDRGY